MIAQRLDNGLLHDGEDLLVEPPAHPEAAGDVKKAVDDPAPELLEVLEEAHTGHFLGSSLLSCFHDGARHRELTWQGREARLWTRRIPGPPANSLDRDDDQLRHG
jgi:hypothetical protein